MRVYRKKIEVSRTPGVQKGEVRVITNATTQESESGGIISTMGVHTIVAESDNKEYRSQMDTIYLSDIEGIAVESELRLREYFENKLNGVTGISTYKILLSNDFECDDKNIGGADV